MEDWLNKFNANFFFGLSSERYPILYSDLQSAICFQYKLSQFSRVFHGTTVKVMLKDEITMFMKDETIKGASISIRSI